MNPTARRTLEALLALVLAGGLAAAAHAATYKFADQGDTTSMDPHSLNESLQLSLLGNIYEPLVGRGKKLELVPVLATSWKQTEPTVWRFNLRRNVKFHDGTPFTADDVIFSYERAQADGSDMKTKIAADQGDAQDRRLHGRLRHQRSVPDPAGHAQHLVHHEQGVVREEQRHHAGRRAQGQGKCATLRANGTGPFMLKSREPGVRTVFVTNPAYWEKVESNVTEAIFTPIKNDATRVAALISGDIDMMEPVPLQDIEQLKCARRR